MAFGDYSANSFANNPETKQYRESTRSSAICPKAQKDLNNDHLMDALARPPSPPLPAPSSITARTSWSHTTARKVIYPRMHTHKMTTYQTTPTQPEDPNLTQISGWG
eukprot:8869838-Pyramimonas_sp.AAC.1